MRRLSILVIALGCAGVVSPALGQQIKLAWDPSPVAGDTYNAYRNVTASFSSANKINSQPIATPSFADSCSSGTRCYYAVTASGLRDVSDTDTTKVLKESGYSNILAVVVDGANRVWSLGPEAAADGNSWAIHLNGSGPYGGAYGVEIAAVNGICYLLGDEPVDPYWYYFDFAANGWVNTGSHDLPVSQQNQVPVVTITVQ